MNTVNNDNDVSIGKNIIAMLKESVKFALVVTVIFLVIGTSVAYILLEFVKTGVEVAGIFDGVATAILVFIVDYKKMHTTDKMAESNRRIFKKIFKKIKNW